MFKLTDNERAQLADAIHLRNEFEHDYCDHGTYSGGLMHGQEYKMCERMAGKHSIVVTTIESIVNGRMANPEDAALDSWENDGGSGFLSDKILMQDAPEGMDDSPRAMLDECTNDVNCEASVHLNSCPNHLIGELG